MGIAEVGDRLFPGLLFVKVMDTDNMQIEAQINQAESHQFKIGMKAKVGLDDGPIFGQGGQGFQRLNIACPRATLELGLRRIEEAVNALA